MSEQGEQWVRIFCDGSCIPNPGYGGWAALLRYQGAEKLISGMITEKTTNQRMEITAALMGLLALTKASRVKIYSDSQYVVNIGNREWSANSNADLWALVFAEERKHEVQWKWIRGHTGHKDNERVNQAANAQATNAFNLVHELED